MVRLRFFVTRSGSVAVFPFRALVRVDAKPILTYSVVLQKPGALRNDAATLWCRRRNDVGEEAPSMTSDRHSRRAEKVLLPQEGGALARGGTEKKYFFLRRGVAAAYAFP